VLVLVMYLHVCHLVCGYMSAQYWSHCPTTVLVTDERCAVLPTIFEKLVGMFPAGPALRILSCRPLITPKTERTREESDSIAADSVKPNEDNDDCLTLQESGNLVLRPARRLHRMCGVPFGPTEASRSQMIASSFQICDERARGARNRALPLQMIFLHLAPWCNVGCI
jgi:hypothetical protein